jgi:hypothetical protein
MGSGAMAYIPSLIKIGSGIRCRSNVFTEPLPSNDRGIHIQTLRLMGGIYKVRHWDGLGCHDLEVLEQAI